MDALTLSHEDPGAPDVRSLLTRHFELMRSQSPAESCHVLEPDALVENGAILLGVRRKSELLGLGALALLDDRNGELKSMHARDTARGQGIGRMILQGLIAEAQRLGLVRVSLETGTAPAFAAARSLYHTHGFTECPPFGSYSVDPLSTYMSRSL